VLIHCVCAAFDMNPAVHGSHVSAKFAEIVLSIQGKHFFAL
jgi:hypothetical protein